MAKQEEGTGRHKHKSAEEPFPHNEAETTSSKGGKQETSGKSEGSGKQEEGTGRHKHKSAEEPFAHNEAETTSGKGGKQEASGKSGGAGKQEHASSGGGGSSSSSQDESSDLKSREYTDAEGNVHHHTKKYEEQHKGK